MIGLPLLAGLLLAARPAPAGEVPRVAVLYSSFPDGACAYRDEYDEDLARLGWPAERFENTQIIPLVQHLDDFNLVIGATAWNAEHWQNLRAYAAPLRRFLRYGGIVLLTDTSTDVQVNWLRAMEPGLNIDAEGQPCVADGRRTTWLDVRHPLLSGISNVPAARTHLSRVSGRWQVLARCPDGKPTFVCREIGDGLVVVTSVSRRDGFPDATFLQNLWLWTRDWGRINAARGREETRYRESLRPREIETKRIDPPPVIDGIIEEETWSRAAQTDAFGDQETRALCGIDDYWLYVAFRCADSDPVGLAANGRPEDPSVLDDDCVELLVDPTGKRETSRRFVVNAAGIAYAEASDDPSWSAWWQAAVQRTPRGWTAEMRIPLVMLGDVGGFSEEWAVNFARHYPRTDDLSSWAPTPGLAGEPPGFGKLRKAKIDPACFPLRLTGIELIDNRLSASFTKPSYGDFRGRFIVECLSPSAVTTQTVREITVGEYDSALVETEHRMADPGTWVLRARVEADGGPVWVSQPIRHLVR
jgi:hypothetical protein